jgi:hypothetical protein
MSGNKNNLEWREVCNDKVSECQWMVEQHGLNKMAVLYLDISLQQTYFFIMLITLVFLSMLKETKCYLPHDLATCNSTEYLLPKMSEWKNSHFLALDES